MVFSVYSSDERATSHRLITFRISSDAIFSTFEPNTYLHTYMYVQRIWYDIHFFYCLFMENGNVYVWILLNLTRMHGECSSSASNWKHKIAVCLLKSLFCWIILRMKCRLFFSFWCTKKFISICCFHFKKTIFFFLSPSLAFGSFISSEFDVVLSLFVRVHDY